jgi:hypothetical protein
MVELGSKTFKIPEANYQKFEAAIAKFSKRAQKLCGESITPVPFSYEMVDAGNGEQIKVIEVLLDCIIPKINGWEFLARIDHANKELGNIIRTMPGKSVDSHFQTVGPVCQHCNVNRFRRDTFVVQHEDTKEIKQVGSTCLKDFLGHDSPEKIAKLAELLGYAVESSRGFTNFTGEDRRYINLEVYLAYVAQSIRERGYFYSRTAARERGGEATADLAASFMNFEYKSHTKTPTEDDFALAASAIEWAQNVGDGEYNGVPMNDYMHNIKVIAASGCCEYRSLGFAASIVNGYLRERRANEGRTERPVSNHIGSIDERLVVVCTLHTVREIETQYGVSVLHQFVTDAGDVIKIFTNKKLGEAGAKVKLRGTVKKHDEYRGVKQTILNRPRVDPLS